MFCNITLGLQLRKSLVHTKNAALPQTIGYSGSLNLANSLLNTILSTTDDCSRAQADIIEASRLTFTTTGQGTPLKLPSNLESLSYPNCRNESSFPVSKAISPQTIS